MAALRTLTDRYSQFICHNNKLILLLLGALFFVLTSQLTKLKIDPTTEGLFHPTDPALINYQTFKKQFGRDDMIIIAIQNDQLFSIDFLKQLTTLHKALEANVPYINKVNSLVNARLTYGENNELIVDDLLKKLPANQAELNDIKNKVISNPMYLNSLISKNGNITTVIIEPLESDNEHEQPQQDDSRTSDDDFSESEWMEDFEDSSEQAQSLKSKEVDKTTTTQAPGMPADSMADTLTSIRQILNQYTPNNSKVYISGTPVIDNTIKMAMQQDMGLFMFLCFIMIAVFLYILFRTWHAVWLPLVVVMATLLCTFSLMGMLSYALKLPTQILPSFLLVVGVGDSVHVLSLFYQNRRAGIGRDESISKALQHCMMAITMTSITTAGGLMAFITSDIAPVADLGIFAPVGVFFAWLFSILLLPALLSMQPDKNMIVSEKLTPRASSKIKQLLQSAVEMAINQPGKVLFASLLITIIAIMGALKLDFSYRPLHWLPEQADVRIATTVIDQQLRGSNTLEIVLDAGKTNGWYNPELLNKLEQAAGKAIHYQNEHIFIGKTSSLVDVLKEIHQALHNNDPKSYQLPRQRDLIAQEILLFENSGSDDLEDFSDSQFRKIRLSLKMPEQDAINYTGFIEHYEQELKQLFGDDVKVMMTGIITLLFKAVDAVSVSMAESYAIAIVVITLLMILFIGNIKTGLISIAPNLLPIIMVLGIMGWFHIPLDAFTLLIGSIALGLVVDDTIHFLNSFNHYYKHGENAGDTKYAIRMTTQTTGQAIVVTSIVLSLGFFIYMLASLSNLFYFGLLTGLAILLALIAEFLVTPALLVKLYPQKS